MPGPPPKPTALKELDGNPGRRPLNKDEPRLEVSAPPCPAYLSKQAKKEWRRIVPILLRMRVLTEADRVMLGNWCTHQAILVEALENLQQSSSLYKTPSGYVQQNPLIGIINKSSAIVSKIASEFGLTPSGRVRLHAQPERGSGRGNKWAGFKTPSKSSDSALPN